MEPLAKPKPQKSKHFHELLREARVRAKQSTEVMAIMLNMEEEDYISIERGETFPDNETLKRLCMMLEWNYYDTQRMVINEISARPSAPGSNDGALEALQGTPLQGKLRGRDDADSLGQRLREVRRSTGQAVEVIAMLLGIEPERYRAMEAGEAPGVDLLRRISMVYDWNYHDLLALLRTEQAHSLQPRRLGSPFPGASAGKLDLRGILHEIEHLFDALPEKDQRFVLTQLELVRETVRRMRHGR